MRGAAPSAWMRRSLEGWHGSARQLAHLSVSAPPPRQSKLETSFGGAPAAGRCYRAPTMSLPPTDSVATCPPPSDKLDLRPIQGARADTELARLAKALGHPARVRILRLLARRNSCVCSEFVGELALAQSTVSQHLKLLKQAGLIRSTHSGPRAFYCVDPRALRRLRALIGGL